VLVRERAIATGFANEVGGEPEGRARLFLTDKGESPFGLNASGNRVGLARSSLATRMAVGGIYGRRTH
jgi:hypothetical protein